LGKTRGSFQVPYLLAFVAVFYFYKRGKVTIPFSITYHPTIFATLLMAEQIIPAL